MSFIPTTNTSTADTVTTVYGYKLRDKEGALFFISNKKNDKLPDLRGTIRIKDKLYDVSVWKKFSKDGKGNPRTFYSVILRAQQEEQEDQEEKNEKIMTTAYGYRLNEKKGALFMSKKLGKHLPELRGTIRIENILYDVSAWRRYTNHAGYPKDFFRLRLREQKQKSMEESKPIAIKNATKPTEQSEEELPF